MEDFFLLKDIQDMDKVTELTLDMDILTPAKDILTIKNNQFITGEVNIECMDRL